MKFITLETLESWTTLKIIQYLLIAISGSVILMSREDGPGLSKEFPWQFRLMAKFRTVLLVYFVVPISFALWLYRKIRDMLRENLKEKDETKIWEGHESRVKGLQGQVIKWNKDGRKKKMRTARPNWAAMSMKRGSNKQDSHMIKSSHLNHILKIDKEKMTITCEPAVNMGQITDKLVPMNLALQVQVEMESITIGGMAMGLGMETNSFRSGLFQETVVAYEIITSKGELMKVTEESDPELFFAMPWSHGSLCFLVSVEARMINIKQYVKMTYIPTYTTQDMEDKIREYGEQTDEEIDARGPFSIEATMYDKDNAVVQLADYCDYDPSDPAQKAIYNPVNYFWKPYFYKHVETFIEKGRNVDYEKQPMQEIMPVKHFYHRFTRSIFWEIEDMIPFANHPFYRVLWGWMGAPEVSLLKLFQGPVIRKASVYAHVVQESIMPLKNCTEGVLRFDNWFGVYPLLVFPIRIYDRQAGGNGSLLTPKKENLIPGRNYGLWVDLGAYGVPKIVRQGKSWDAKRIIREMEHWSTEIGAWIVPYTDNFFTPKEFRQHFNHALYDKVRKKFDCLDAFPEFYEKVKTEPGIVDLSLEEALEKKGK